MQPNSEHHEPEPVTRPMNFYEHLRITDDKPEEMPEAIVTMHGIPVSTRKNLTLLSGASKAGKTAITSVICAGAIQSKGIDGCANIEVAENCYEHAVLHVDTEQSRYHHYRNFKSAVLKRAGLPTAPDYYYSYNIRSLNIIEYKTFLDSLFAKAYAMHDGIHLAVIDGAADFIASVNDEIESNSIVSYFEQLAIKYDTTILLVLHVNPGTEKERGHLGSQLQRKCESVLSIKKEGDLSVLEAKLLRGGASGQFTPIYYQFDDNKGYHVFMDATDVYGKRSALQELANQVFTKALNYANAVKKIEDTDRCATPTAKRKIKEMLTAGVVEKREEGFSVFYSLVKDSAGPKTPL